MIGAAQTALLLAAHKCDHVKFAVLFYHEEAPYAYLWEKVRSEEGTWKKDFAVVKQGCTRDKIRVRQPPVVGEDFWFIAEEDNFYGCYDELVFARGSVCRSLESLKKKMEESNERLRFLFYSPKMDVEMDKL